MTFARLTRDQVGPDTPLRLDAAASLAFPDGSVTGEALRREAARGRLIIERVAGKYYTTLANIKRMRELCRVASPKLPDCGSGRNGAAPTESLPTAPPGSSSIEAARSALDAELTSLERQSRH